MSAPFVGKLNALFDSAIGALAGIDAAHYKIHGGLHFEYSRLDVLGSGGDLEILVSVPANTFAHMLFETVCTVEYDAFFYENTTRSGGTGVSPVNNSRPSGNASGISLSVSPSGGALGDQLRIWGGGDAGGFFTGVDPAANRGDSEFILNDNDYLLRIVSGGADNRVFTRLFWYE